MERLTKNMPAAHFKAVPVNIAIDFAFELDDATWLGLQKIFDRLAEYEDTGLTPAEITATADRLRQAEEEKATTDRVAVMVDLATHAIGMNNKKPYKRHGKTWYKPYRNFYCSGKQGDPMWEEMVKQGYAEESKGLGSVYYHMTRTGLDWLGEQIGVTIHDEER